MLLAGPQLVSLATDGTIDAPLPHVNASSIDVRVGEELLIEDVPRHIQPDNHPIIDFNDPRSGMELRRIAIGDNGYVLKPGQFALASIIEHINLPDTISAEFSLRSSVARYGLEHMEAGWIDAGFRGYVTLELKNVTQNHGIKIYPFMRLGQIKFFRHQHAAKHSYRFKGRYHLQGKNPQPSKGVI